MMNTSELMALDESLGKRRVLSVYLDGTATDPASQDSWRVQLRHSLHDLRIWLEGSAHSEREQFELCVTLLDKELEEFQGNIGAPGWAAFITVDGVHASSPLPVPMRTLAVWSTGICMAPYTRALRELRPLIVGMVDSKRADLYRYDGGTLRPVITLRAPHAAMAPSHMGDAPRLGFHPGTRGNTGHDAAQKSLLEGTSRMIAEAASRIMSEAGTEGWILIGGIPEASRHLSDRLRPVAPNRVLAAPLDINASAAELLDAARTAAATLRDRMDASRVAAIIEGESTGLGAVGPAEARLTLDQQRVRALYVTGRYIEDHAADAETAIRAALKQGAVVEAISGPAAELLDSHGGMAARLRYRLAWTMAASRVS